jgi:ribonuclease P protein subunit RPR2
LYKKIAEKRIEKLFQLAEEKAISNKFDLANRYVELARKISMRYRVPIPKKYKRRFCKHCYRYLKPGVTSRVRVSSGKLVIYCKNCNKFMRIPFKNSRYA